MRKLSLTFRELDKKEEKEFRQWARDNYKKGDEIKPIWHPVVRDECNKINEDRKISLELLETILYREDSIINPDDVDSLMKVITSEAKYENLSEGK